MPARPGDLLSFQLLVSSRTSDSIICISFYSSDTLLKKSKYPERCRYLFNTFHRCKDSVSFTGVFLFSSNNPLLFNFSTAFPADMLFLMYLNRFLMFNLISVAIHPSNLFFFWLAWPLHFSCCILYIFLFSRFRHNFHFLKEGLFPFMAS